ATVGLIGHNPYCGSAMQLRLETDGAVIIRRFLSDQDFGRIAEMAGNAFAFLEAGGGDTALRETWISVGTIWLTNLEHCVAPELAPGDALIFDHWTLHRTQPLDRETVSRMSIECRVTRHPAYLVLSQPSSGQPGKLPPQPRSPRRQQDARYILTH